MPSASSPPEVASGLSLHEARRRCGATCTTRTSRRYYGGKSLCLKSTRHRCQSRFSPQSLARHAGRGGTRPSDEKVGASPQHPCCGGAAPALRPRCTHMAPALRPRYARAAPALCAVPALRPRFLRPSRFWSWYPQRHWPWRPAPPPPLACECAAGIGVRSLGRVTPRAPSRVWWRHRRRRRPLFIGDPFLRPVEG